MIKVTSYHFFLLSLLILPRITKTADNVDVATIDPTHVLHWIQNTYSDSNAFAELQLNNILGHTEKYCQKEELSYLLKLAISKHFPENDKQIAPIPIFKSDSPKRELKEKILMHQEELKSYLFLRYVQYKTKKSAVFERDRKKRIQLDSRKISEVYNQFKLRQLKLPDDLLFEEAFDTALNELISEYQNQHPSSFLENIKPILGEERYNDLLSSLTHDQKERLNRCTDIEEFMQLFGEFERDENQ